MTKMVPSRAKVPAIKWPAIATVTGPMLTELTTALGVERAILASDEQIGHAWSNLPRLLTKIPPEQRSEVLVRMCVAVAAGLFDSAINYAWNAAIIELREKVRRFGLTVVPQVIARPFDETTLLDLRDAELLQLCLKLNLISEDGHFLLDQCRDIRNNFSAAHPSVGALDEDELVTFLNRCAKHALSNERNPRGVDIQGFIAAIKYTKFTRAQIDTWRARLANTFEAQREVLFGMLHGIYCDPASGEEARVNALAVCIEFGAALTPKTRSELVDRHQDYQAKGDEKRHKASQQFFERLALLDLLGQAELHSLITAACSNLLSVHNAMNNFYNEPSFAERLLALVSSAAVPESAQHDFVIAVVTCAIGNPYGVSHAATSYYEKMIRSFSPNEVRIMLELPETSAIAARRIGNHPRCKERFAELVAMLDATTVPTSARKAYSKWLVESFS